MLRNKKVIAIMLAFAMVFTALSPAFAATTNTPTGVPNVSDGDEKSLGQLVIREDFDNEGNFNDGDVVTINLPSGVKYDPVPTVTDAVYDGYLEVVPGAGTDGSLDVEVVAAGESFLSFKIDDSRTAGDEARIIVKFPSVKIDSDVTGDIKVEVDAAGTSITSGFYTIARVIGGDTTTTVSKVETIGLGSEKTIGTIRITENSAGVLDKNGDIELVLPNNFKWVESATVNIQGTRELDASGPTYSDNKRTAKFVVTSETVGNQPGFLAISGLEIEVDDKARVGEVEMTVKGSDVTREDIVIIKTGDFGFKVETKGDIETLVAGKVEEEIAEIRIDDTVANSWIEDRTVILTLPSGVEFDESAVSIAVKDSRIKSARLNSDNDELRMVASGSNGEAKFDSFKVNLDADAKPGDLVVTVSGSLGIDEELVVAKIAAPFEITAEKPQFKIGIQDQNLGNITLTEPEDGAVDEGKWIIFRAPTGMEFARTPKVDVTEGDMEIDKEDIDRNLFAFRVKSESSRDAASIEISDIQMTLDRTVPVGDITFDVYMTKTGDRDDSTESYVNYVGTKFDRAVDRDNRDQVTDVVVGTVVTPAPGAGSALFTIGSTIYYVDGVAKFVEAAPYIKGDRTYIPVRAAAEATGAVVDYDEATRTVTATKDGNEVVLVIGQVGASGVAPEIVNDRTFVPIRDLEGLGISLGYDAQSKQVLVQN